MIIMDGIAVGSGSAPPRSMMLAPRRRSSSAHHTLRDSVTKEPRIGYFHRESSRFVATDLDGFIWTHFRTDEAHVAGLPSSTYRD